MCTIREELDIRHGEHTHWWAICSCGKDIAGRWCTVKGRADIRAFWTGLHDLELRDGRQPTGCS